MNVKARFDNIVIKVWDNQTGSSISSTDFLGSMTDDSWYDASYTVDYSGWTGSSIRVSITASGVDDEDYTQVGATKFSIEYISLEQYDASS